MAQPIIGITCCRWRLKEDGHFFHLVGEKYIQAAVAAGGLPLLIPALGDASQLEQILSSIDGLLLTGSQSNIEPQHYQGQVLANDFNDPQRDATTLPLIRAAVALGVPVLGICRGAQEVNVAFGGTLEQAVHQQTGKLDHREQGSSLDEMYGPAHEIELVTGGLLHQLYGQTSARVNSLHHQGVATLGAGLQIEALAPDGLIEAFSVSHAARFALAVQWHPEWRFQDNSLSMAMLTGFAAACTQRQLSAKKR
ncbi:gamma-glutamyl-gamma-aminobutyrate hydrolase family protein [Iodobacter sp.]|uniref:gamma-glutamyl-gamma-aminobutyrate hydrolase family protein n=1 Tax=Iodobacter sp. TaxID=1915058 RepID=UPI0025CE866D|nr:gamma-glutamyl-gamma-aminobutyrate hydrolase family protein [Iodobacter sp.]